MHCALCVPTPHRVLWQDNFCRVVLLSDEDYPAYCRVELLAHVKEMTDLPAESRARLMHVVFAVEAALRQLFNPDKINLVSLGNKTPHIHWHVIPRFETDKHYPNSHWGEALRAGEPRLLSAEMITALIEKIATAMA
ncbi:MAG: HIT family protein [Betaproteobacteria bacterium HGW-Betaproteobacteria-22]|nr:MAG: HIT family protein [Betaproteobacteria bacterium HGW-Betaproteobacteria-22]